MGMIQQYSNAGSASGSSSSSGSRPIPTRSQTNPPVPDFEFSLPNVRPGLAKIGRRISEMSDNFLYETDVIANDGPGGLSRSASRKGVPRIQEERHVPFMGDEPVFCPFCEKPLPPGLLSQHAHLEPPPMPRKGLAVPASASMSKTISAPEGSKGLLSALPVVTPPIAPTKPEPRTTSEELAPPVKAGDMADHAASKVSVSDDDLRRWAKFAGVELDLPVDASIAQKVPEPTAPAKPFPKLAPPPEDEARSTSTSRNSGRFGFFGGKSGKDEDDEEESDDDQGGAGGYSRLDAPASPEREEKPLEPLDFKERKVTETVQAKEPELIAPVEPVPASEEEVRAVLKEVLAKVNEMVSQQSRRTNVCLHTGQIPHICPTLAQHIVDDAQNRSIKPGNGGSECRDARRATQALRYTDQATETIAHQYRPPWLNGPSTASSSRTHAHYHYASSFGSDTAWRLVELHTRCASLYRINPTSFDPNTHFGQPPHPGLCFV
jgi:hypothetical protein